MADDFVPASPILRKTQKRQASILKRRAKRRREKAGNKSEVSASESVVQDENISRYDEDETTKENAAEISILSPKPAADISALYWSSEEKEYGRRDDFDEFDMFAEVRLLEEANKVPPSQPCKIPREMATGDDWVTFDAMSQRMGWEQKEPTVVCPMVPPPDTQFPTETEFLRVCEVVDAVSDLHRNVPRFSQWGSPFAKLPVEDTLTPDRDKKTTISQERKHRIPLASTPINHITNVPIASTSYSCLKHSGEREKPVRKRIDFYDSDSKSSISSGLSVQSDEVVLATPVDAVDLNKSQHIQENLQSLSAFFSQQSQPNSDGDTIDGVFRYIMLEKSKREVALNCPNSSEKCLALNRTDSSRSFKGFDVRARAESNRSSSVAVDELLEHGDDFFENVSTAMDNRRQPASQVDVDTILRNADSALLRASQNDGFSQGDDSFSRIHYNDERLRNSSQTNDVNINNLLHGAILSTPKNKQFTESTIGDSSPMQWIMRPKPNNSITASDIELEREDDRNESPKSKDILNTTYVIDKTSSSLNPDDSFANITEIHVPQIDPELDQMVNDQCKKVLSETENRLHEMSKSHQPAVTDSKFDACSIFTPGFGKRTAEGMMDDIMCDEFDHEMAIDECDERKSTTIDDSLNNFGSSNIENQPSVANLVSVKQPTVEDSHQIGSEVRSMCTLDKAFENKDSVLPNRTCNENVNDVPNIEEDMPCPVFKTALGVEIKISESARERAAKFMAEFDDPNDDLVSYGTTSIRPDISTKSCEINECASLTRKSNPGGGPSFEEPPPDYKPVFRTALNKEIPISTEARERGLKMLLEEMGPDSVNIQMVASPVDISPAEDVNNLKPNASAASSGKKDNSSATLPSTSFISIRPVSSNVFSFVCEEPPPDYKPVFRTALNKDIPISAQARERGLKMLLEEMGPENVNIEIAASSMEKEGPSSVNITAGTIKPCPVSLAKDLNNLKPNISEPSGRKDDSRVALSSTSSISTRSPKPCVFNFGNEEPPPDYKPVFRTALNQEIRISANARQRGIQMVLEEMGGEDDFVQNKWAHLESQRPCPKFMTAYGEEIQISETALQKAAKLMAEFVDCDDFGKYSDMINELSDKEKTVDSNQITPSTSRNILKSAEKVTTEETNRSDKIADIGENLNDKQTERTSSKQEEIDGLPAGCNCPFRKASNKVGSRMPSGSKASDHDFAGPSHGPENFGMGPTFDEPPPDYEPIFRTALNQEIPISAKARLRGMQILQEIWPENESDAYGGETCPSPEISLVEESASKNQNDIPCPVFKNGWGEEIKISKDARERAARFMAEFDQADYETLDSSENENDGLERVGKSQYLRVEHQKDIKPQTNARVEINQKDEKPKNEDQPAESKAINCNKKAISRFDKLKNDFQTARTAEEEPNGNFDNKRSTKDSGKPPAVAKPIMVEDEDEVLENVKLTPTIVKQKSIEDLPEKQLDAAILPESPPRRVLRSHSTASNKAPIATRSKPTISSKSKRLHKAKSQRQSDMQSTASAEIPSGDNSSTALTTPCASSAINSNITTSVRIASTLTISPLAETLTPLRSTPTQKPASKRLSLTRKKFKPPSIISENSSTPIRPIPLHIQHSTPNLNDFFQSVDTSTPKNISKMRGSQKFSLTQEVSASTAALLLDDEADCRENDSGMRQILWDLGVDESAERAEKTVSKNSTSADILKKRVTKRQEQLQTIESKSRFSGDVKGGAHFVRKSRPDRMRLRELIDDNSAKRVASTVDPDTALDFRFIVNNDVIAMPTEDACSIIPDDQNRIGFTEIKNAFLSIPAVAPGLVPIHWIQHHYRMIVLKLGWLESIRRDFLTPENVCLQLKYRYDHEIDRAHRMAIHRILECDDTPTKRMVLVVLQIHNSQFHTELELSDRWYSVRTVIDGAMQSLIDSGKVRVGTKLMVQSSELLNCENGCSPLEMRHDVRLKIHTNSTRRARWDTKLGFYRTKKPFLLKLSQVSMYGGLITKLELFILRVYPSMYLRGDGKDGRPQDIHSEKVEQRLANREGISKLSAVESIFSQVQKQLELEDEQPKTKRRKVETSIQEIEDPEELYNLLHFEGDASEIEAELSLQQRQQLADYQQQLHAQRMKEVHRRVQERLQTEPAASRSKELLKLLVTDRNSPATFAVLSIWSPGPELKELLHENRAIEVTHLRPKEHHTSELQLTSTKLSQYRILPDIHSIPRHLIRQITPIGDIYSTNFEPAFNELDTYGLVVFIDNDILNTKHSQKFQSAFLTDIDMNILCINFWAGVKDYGYEDVVQMQRFVAINNLQWRSNSSRTPIPCAFATLTTTFTEKPKNQDMLHALTNFKEHFSDDQNSIQEFVERCQEKIREIKSRPKLCATLVSSVSMMTTTLNSTMATTMNGSNNLNDSTNTGSDRSASMNATVGLLNVSSVQKRIDKLQLYGKAPDLSPIEMKRSRAVRKNFKVPRKIDTDSISDKS